MTDDAEIGRDHPLNAQQYQALSRQFQDSVRRVVNDTELRKLSLEKAVAIAGLGGEPVSTEALVGLAAALYAFLSAPAAEVKITAG